MSAEQVVGTAPEFQELELFDADGALLRRIGAGERDADAVRDAFA